MQFPTQQGCLFLQYALCVPVPPAPLLEDALGYHGAAQFWAFYWGGGDEAFITDGQEEQPGEWWGYLAFVTHPQILPGLQSVQNMLGSSEDPATHWLILDRESRQLFVAPESEARQFLQGQWINARWRAVAALLQTDLEALLARVRQTLQTQSLTEAKPLQASSLQGSVTALVQWLDSL